MADVRRATAADLEVLVEMGRAMHAESPRYREMRFDADKVFRLVANMVTWTDAGAIFVAQAEGEVIGMAAIVAGERWFGDERYVTDLAVYLKPQHRGNGAFPLLVLEVELWAKAHGVRDLDLGVSTGIDAGRTVRAYERLGYTVLDTRVVTKRLDDDVHRS